MTLVVFKQEEGESGQSTGAATGLQIIGATFGGVTVTEKIRELREDDDSITIDMGQMVHYLAPDPHPNSAKTLTALYQFDDGPLFLLNATELHPGPIQISRVPVPSTAIQRLDDGGFKRKPYADVEIIALVYGKYRIRTPSVLLELARFFSDEEHRSPIRMVNSFFKEDTWPNNLKSWTIFFKFVDSKRIQCVTGPENGALELPWSRYD